MMPVMEQPRIESAGASWRFAGSVQCQPVAGSGWRLTGVERSAAAVAGSQTAGSPPAGALPAGSTLIIDIVADAATSRELAEVATVALRDVVLQRDAGRAADWWLEAGGRRWRLPAASVFAHRDVGGMALAAIPPRRVPVGKRIFWSTLLAVLRTEAGRRWVRRRYGV
jgi:hypothetical protein